MRQIHTQHEGEKPNLSMDPEVIRLEIDNTDNELSREEINEIINNLSRLTSRLTRRYKISNERFKLITGRSLLEKLLNIA